MKNLIYALTGVLFVGAGLSWLRVVVLMRRSLAVPCPICRGSGSAWDGGVCKVCQGTGELQGPPPKKA